MDLSRLSEQDLRALAANDLSSVSEAGLRIIAGIPAPQPAEGVFAAGQGGLENLLSRSRTGVEAIFDPEGAARRGLERGEDISQRLAPGASLQRVKDVYAEQGLLPAAGEAISQIPSALAEQAPNIAASIASAKLGAMGGYCCYSPVLVPLLVVLVVRWLRLCFSCLVHTLSVKLKKAQIFLVVVRWLQPFPVLHLKWHLRSSPLVVR
jgi:hypothetical protein